MDQSNLSEIPEFGYFPSSTNQLFERKVDERMNPIWLQRANCSMDKFAPFYTNYCEYFIFPAAIVSIVTSVLSLTVIIRETFPNHVTCHLFVLLRGSDICFITAITTYLFLNTPQSLINKIDDRTYHALLTTSNFFSFTSEMFRNWTIVLIAVERYIMTRRWSMSKRLVTVRNIYASASVIFIFSLCLSIPIVVEAFTFLDQCSKIYAWSYKIHTLFVFLFLALLPMTALLYLCVTTIAAVNRCGKQIGVNRHSGVRVTSRYQLTSRITKIVMTSLIVFLIFMTPYLVYTLLLMTTTTMEIKNCDQLILINVLFYVVTSGTCLNSMADFFIFLACCQKFRRALVCMCLCNGKN